MKYVEPLTRAPTEWRPTHAPSTSGSESPEAGAPDGAGWLDLIPNTEPLFLGIIGLHPEIRVTFKGRDYSGSGATFSHPSDRS
jgi:hypothetical protein